MAPITTRWFVNNVIIVTFASILHHYLRVMATEVKTALGKIIKMKCPHCGKGHLFVNESAFSFSKLGQVKSECTECGTNFNPEPGFYFGAAYVSWGLTVAMWVAILIALKTFDAMGVLEFGFLTHPKTFLLTGVVLTILLFPVLYKLSRSIWASSFIK
jgi:uncharacterized protein (DUF983 family)